MKGNNSGLLVLVIFLLIFSINCVSPSVASNDLEPGIKNKPVTNNHNNEKSNAVSEKTRHSSAKKFFVILSSVSLEGDILKLDNEFWGHEETEEGAKSYPDDKVEIDIMNCAGYLASGITTYRQKGGMRKVQLIPETAAKDVSEKIKQCRADSDIYGDKVFGVAPRSADRRNIKVGRIDTKKLYDSLLKDIRKTKIAVNSESEDEITPPLKITKGKLSLGEDNWTDLDGDGQIDLIEFHDTPCDEKETCTWIFRSINGKWKSIDYVFPL